MQSFLWFDLTSIMNASIFNEFLEFKFLTVFWNLKNLKLNSFWKFKFQRNKILNFTSLLCLSLPKSFNKANQKCCTSSIHSPNLPQLTLYFRPIYLLQNAFYFPFPPLTHPHFAFQQTIIRTATAATTRTRAIVSKKKTKKEKKIGTLRA